MSRELANLMRGARLRFQDPETGRLGLSMEALAERAGVSPATIQSLESGRRRPSGLSFKRVCAALGLEPADILSRLAPEDQAALRRELGMGVESVG